MKRYYYVAVCLIVTITMNAVDVIDKHKAVQAYRAGDYAHAYDLFETLYVRNPEDQEIAYNMAKSAYGLQQFDKAHALYESVIASESASDDLKKQAHFDVGNAFVRHKKFDQAMEQFQRVLEYDPEHFHAQEMIEKIQEHLEREQEQQEQQEQQESQESPEGESDSTDSSSGDPHEPGDHHDGQGDLEDEVSPDEGGQRGDQGSQDQGDDQSLGQRPEQIDGSPDNNDQQDNSDGVQPQHQQPSQQGEQSESQQTQDMLSELQAQEFEYKEDDPLNEDEQTLVRMLHEQEADALKNLVNAHIKGMPRDGSQKNW